MDSKSQFCFNMSLLCRNTLKVYFQEAKTVHNNQKGLIICNYANDANSFTFIDNTEYDFIRKS